MILKMNSDKKYLYIFLLLLLEPFSFNYIGIIDNKTNFTNPVDFDFDSGILKTSDQQTELIELWNKTYDWDYVDNSKSIIKCTNGDYAIAGWTNSSGAGDLDIWLIRISADGTHLWNYTYGAAEEDKGFQVIECSTGGFAISATYTNNSAAITNKDCMVVRVADDGSLLWQLSYSGPEQNASHWIGDLGRSIVECANGDFVLTGVTDTNVGDGDIWFFRIDRFGKRLWDKTYHNRITDRCYTPHSLVQCKDGGFAIAGYTHNSSYPNDVWLLRTAPDGILIWNQTYGGSDYDRPEALVECQDGGFAIIANTKSFGAGGGDAWVIRTDSGGVPIWNKTFGGAGEDGGSQIVEMPGGGFTIVGSTHSFDIGGGDLWLVRMDQAGDLLWNHTLGDAYGNGGSSFIFEGNNTYTCTGTTHLVGDPFQDLWVVKVHIKILPPTNGTTNGDNTLFFWLIIIGILAVLVVSTVIIWKYVSQKSRTEELGK